jgi:hypothetical protein
MERKAMKVILKLLVVLLLFLTPSSLNSSSFNERIGVIFINLDGSYTLKSFAINQSCDVWWKNNLSITERLNPKDNESWVVHTVFNEPVLGKICNY